MGPTQPSPLLLCPSPSSPHSCTAATHHLPAPAVASFYVKAAWSPDGSHIISGSTDRSVYIWEVGWGLQLWCPFQCSSWLPHHVPHAGMVWSRRRPVHGCSSNVQLSLPRLSIAQLPPPPSQVDAPDGASPYVLPGHQGEVTAVAWCPSDFQQVRGWGVYEMCSWRACSAGAGAAHTAG